MLKLLAICINSRLLSENFWRSYKDASQEICPSSKSAANTIWGPLKVFDSSCLFLVPEIFLFTRTKLVQSTKLRRFSHVLNSQSESQRRTISSHRNSLTMLWRFFFGPCWKNNVWMLKLTSEFWYRTSKSLIVESPIYYVDKGNIIGFNIIDSSTNKELPDVKYSPVHLVHSFKQNLLLVFFDATHNGGKSSQTKSHFAHACETCVYIWELKKVWQCALRRLWSYEFFCNVYQDLTKEFCRMVLEERIILVLSKIILKAFDKYFPNLLLSYVVHAIARNRFHFKSSI